MTSRIPRAAAAVTLAACLALWLPMSAFAQEVFAPNDPTSAELVERMRVPGDVSAGLYWNGRTITFHGEAIGESMVRGNHAWIHLNDDAYMERNVEEGAPLKGYNSGMAVWLPASAVKVIDTYGDHSHEGSIVEVTGVFNGACRQHGGDTDIHAATLGVLRVGHVVVDPIPPWKGSVAAVLALLALALFFYERRHRRTLRERGEM